MKMMAVPFALRLVEVFHLRHGQLGGGLVHDDDLRVFGDGLGDLHQLLLGGGQGSHRRPGIDVDMVFVKQLLGDPKLLLHIHDAPHLVAEADVLRGGEGGDQVVLLIDDLHAVAPGLGGGHVFKLLPVDPDAALFVLHRAGQDLDQGGLSRAVLSQKRVDLPLIHLQVHLVQRHHAGVELGDALHF